MNRILIFFIYLLYAEVIFVTSGCKTSDQIKNKPLTHTDWIYFQYEDTPGIETEQITILKNAIKKIIIKFLQNKPYDNAIFTFNDIKFLFQKDLEISVSGQLKYTRIAKLNLSQQQNSESIYYYCNNDNWQGEISGKLLVSLNNKHYIEYPLKIKKNRFFIRPMHFHGRTEWSSFLNQYEE